jgi:L-ascorbate metabolism protein UlaG (beta-lactamase superfamily)
MTLLGRAFSILSAAMPIELTYYGHAGFKLQTPSGNFLLIDPWLRNPLLQNAEQELRALDRVDLICLTHGHSDHVADAVEIAKKTKAKLVATFELAAAMRTALDYPAELVDSELIGHFGGEIVLLDGEITARFVPALHGSMIMPDDKSPPVYAGTPSGVVLALRGGPTIYHTGDTDLFSDMALVSRERAIDYMLVCMGGHFTMGPSRAAEAVELVKPKFVIPIHFGTFPLLKGTPEMLQHEMSTRGSKAKMRIMKPGEKLDISGT